MRISLKVIGILWIGLLLIIGGLLYNAYSKLKPETFIALLREQVHKNYPDAKLDVGNISYKFSLDFNLNLQNIRLNRSGKLLGSVGEIELKVPWWLLLFNRGNAQINLSKLDIFIDHAEAPIFKDKVIPPQASSPGAASSSKLIKVTLPSYLANAKFTLRAKEISVKDSHSDHRYFVVSKLLVREFQYGKNSAFEINIPISIKHNSIQYATELWLFGDVTPDPSQWKLNYRGEFRTKEANDKIQIDDLVIDGKASFVPSTLATSSDLSLLIEKSIIGSGKFKANQENLSIALNLVKLPLNYFGFLYDEIKNPYLSQFDGDASGLIKFNKDFNTAVAAVNGKLFFDGNLRLSDKDTIPGKWQIGFQDSRWDVSFISPKGEASFFRRSVIDSKKNIVVQYIEELGFTGQDLNLTMAPVMPIAEFIKNVPPSYFTTSIKYINCLQGDKTLNGSFKYGLSPDQKFYQGELGDANSTLKIAYSNKSGNHSLDLNLTKFKMNPYVKIFSPLLTSSDAEVDGKLEGRWETKWEYGQWLVNLNMDGGLDSKGEIPDFVTQTSGHFGIDLKDTKKQSLNLLARNSILTLNSLLLENSQAIKISGSLSTKQKSYLTLTYPKNKRFKALRKDIVEPYWTEKDEL